MKHRMGIVVPVLLLALTALTLLACDQGERRAPRIGAETSLPAVEPPGDGYLFEADADNGLLAESRSDPETDPAKLTDLRGGNRVASKPEVFNRQPWDGVAVRTMYKLNVASFDDELWEQSIRIANTRIDKDVIPWVLFSRAVGAWSGARSNGTPYMANPDDPPSYVICSRGSLGADCLHPSYLDLPSLDLYDVSEGLTAFFTMWKAALRFARETDSPYLILDLEAYKNHNAYYVPAIAAESSRSLIEVKRRLMKVGALIADHALELYPRVSIIMYSTYFQPKLNPSHPDVGYTTPDPDGIRHAYAEWSTDDSDVATGGAMAFVALGLLERMLERGAETLVYEGGFFSLGYYTEYVNDPDRPGNSLVPRIRAQRRRYQEYLDAYPNFRLAGTTAVWLRQTHPRSPFYGYPARTVEDLSPWVREVLSSYRVRWIWPVGGYEPLSYLRPQLYRERFRPDALRFERVIEDARTAVSSRSPGSP